MMQATTSKRSGAKKRFVRNAAKKVETGLKDYDQFIKEGEKSKVSFVIAGTDEDLIQVNDWIRMPEPIRDLIGHEGIPCGLISMVYGKPDGGKTTFCNEALASTQRDGGFAILFLTELKYDYKRAAAQGVRVDGEKGSLIKFLPKTIEQVGDFIFDVSKLIEKTKTKKKVCIVWDSMPATPCENELDEKRSNFGMDAARAITGVLRRTQALIRDKNIAFVMINQIRDKTGVTWGKKTTTKGGYSPKYHSALQLEFSQIGKIRPPGTKPGADPAGIKSKIYVEKNHLGPPFKSTEILIDWKGFVIDRDAEYAPKGYFNGEDSTDIPSEEKEGVS